MIWTRFSSKKAEQMVAFDTYWLFIDPVYQWSFSKITRSVRR
jgi:hypothetical protein